MTKMPSLLSAMFLLSVCAPLRAQVGDFIIPTPKGVLETARKSGANMQVKGAAAATLMAPMPGLSKEVLQQNGVQLEPTDTASQVLEKLFNSPNATVPTKEELTGIWAGRRFFKPNKGEMELLSGGLVKGVIDGGPLFSGQEKVFKIGFYSEMVDPSEPSVAAKYDNGIRDYMKKIVTSGLDTSANRASPPQFSDSEVRFTDEFGAGVQLRKVGAYLVIQRSYTDGGKNYSYCFRHLK